MKAVKKIEISVLHKRITPIVYAMQGDTGREIECTVIDWEIPEGVSARVWVVKPSKKVAYNYCRIVDKAVFVSLTNQMLAEPGGAICVIEFKSGDDIVSSFTFNLYVYESASGDGIPSENESTVLEQMFEELAQDAIKTLEAAKAEAAAAKKSAQETEKIKNDFTLTAQQATADVNNAGQTQTQRVNEAGDTQVSRVQSEGTTQVKNVQTAAAEISSDREQIHTNRDNTAQLQRTTASAIIREAEGSFLTLEDAVEGKGYRKLDVQGMTVQDGVPAPDAEVPLENVGVLNPETGKYEVTVHSSGAQLYDEEKYPLENGVWINSNSGTAVFDSKYKATLEFIPIKYYTGKTINLNKPSTGANPGMAFYDVNKVYISGGKGSAITVPINAEYMKFCVDSNADEIMINLGDTALPWEPYRGRTATVTSDRPLTQWDKLTCRDGVWGCLYDIGKDTETWTPLTDQEQSAMNALCSYAGTTHIWTDDPLQPVISLEYTVDTETYIRETAPAYADIGKVAVTGEASGEFVTCRDSAEWPLLEMEVYGKTEQVKTTGAQLLRITASSKTQNGITFTDEGNGIIAIKGTATANANINLGNVTLQPGTYTLSGCPTGGNNTKYQLVLHGGRNIYDTGRTAVFSATDESPMTAAFYVYAGTTVNFSVKPMLNAGDTALPWEPYTGAAPSPSPAYKQDIQETGTYNPETGMYEADMVMTGSNLFNPQALLDVGFVLQPDGSYYIDQAHKPYLKVMWENKYNIDVSVVRLKIKQVLYDNLIGILFSVYYTDGTREGVESPNDTSWHDLIFNPAKKIDRIVFSYGTSLASTYMKDVIISTTTESYSPYIAKSLRLTADQPWRGIGDAHDEVCDRDGVLGTWQKYAVVDNTKWGMSNVQAGTTGMRFAITLPGMEKKQYTKVMCSHFEQKDISSFATEGEYISTSESANGKLMIRVAEGFPATTAEEFCTWAQKNGLYTVYPLENPVWEPFPEDIQKQYRKLKPYAGTTHAWVDDPLQPEVSFRYVKDSKLVLGKLEDRLATLEAGQAQTAAAFSYLPPETQAAMIENETRDLLSTIQEEEK